MKYVTYDLLVAWKSLTIYGLIESSDRLTVIEQLLSFCNANSAALAAADAHNVGSTLKYF